MPPVTPSMLVVFGIVLGALVLFYTEALPLDVSAILIIVVLAVLEPWTGISSAESISGFANPATITVMAMLFLAEGIRETGAIQMLGTWLSSFAGRDQRRQLASTIGLGALPAGVVNNTPVVAMLVPVVSQMARHGKQSPSKYLIPLSYAAQLGGMLTLIGTSTNLLASDVSARLIDRRLSMFEFTPLGIIVLVVGALYLYLFSTRLLPERVDPEETDLERYDAEEFLSEVVVGAESSSIGRPIGDWVASLSGSLSPIVVKRGDRRLEQPFEQMHIRAGDTIVVRATSEAINELLAEPSLEPTDATTGRVCPLSEEEEARITAEIVVAQGASFEGDTLRDSEFLDNYAAQVLAIRSRGENLHRDLQDYELHAGDTLLIAGSQACLEQLMRHGDVILAHNLEHPRYQPEKIPIVGAIMVAVVLLPALEVASIVTTALAGIVAMVVAGVIRLGDIYDRMHWEVIFLLAGVIPLGQALENSGGADLLGSLVALSGTIFPAIVVLWIFYLSTSLITEVISNNASVVLMIPVGIETAQQIGADPFAFVLVVMFAASTAFLTPIGYQTNLIVYGPGGYHFSDYAKVGAPLMAILSVATVAGIYWIWGV